MLIDANQNKPQPVTAAISQDTPLTLMTSGGSRFSIDWSTWHPIDTAVLTFIRQDNNVLLIVKKRGLGQGKVNAPGGRIETGETPQQAAIRETREEVGLTPHNLHHAGQLDFVFTDGYSLHCQVFTAAGYSGVMTESDEADPFWCKVNAIPYAKMWSDDRLWIPLMLEGTPFAAQFVFEKDLMLWHTLNVFFNPPENPLSSPAGT